MSSPRTPEELERAIDRLTRAQPPRHAPPSLARAVLAQIERRAARPWWRRDFLQWPGVARVVFLLGACLPAVFACLALGRLDDRFTAVSQHVESTPQFTAVHALGTAMSLVARVLSSEWLYGSAIAVALLYAALFGLGAAGYRVLYARR